MGTVRASGLSSLLVGTLLLDVTSAGTNWGGGRNKTSNLTGCGLTHITIDNFISEGVPEFVAAEMKIFHGSEWEKGDEFFKSYFVPKWTKIDPETIATCNVAQQCSMIKNCEDMKNPGDNATMMDMSRAYSVLIQSQNYMNYNNHIHEGLQTVPGQVANQLPFVIKQFSYADEVAKFVKNKQVDHDRHVAMTVNTVGFVISLAAIVTGLPPIEAMLTDVAVTKTTVDLTGWTVKSFSELLAKQNAAAKEVSSLISYIGAGLFAAGTVRGYIETDYNSHKLIGDAMRASMSADFQHGMEDMGMMFSQRFESLNEGLASVSNTIFHGYNVSDGSVSRNLVDIISTGIFLRAPQQIGPQISAMLKTFFITDIINSMWADENIYILENNGNCSSDGRGPLKNKVCLQEFPDHVYHVYAIPRWQELGHHKKTRISSPDFPPGWDLLSSDEGFEGITAEMIVRSAVTSFHNEGRNRPTESFADPAINFAKRPFSVLDFTPAREGVFNIAVCNDPNGQFISSVNTQSGRHYPCQCLAPSQKSAWPVEKAEAEKHMGYFLDVSGLSRSKDLVEGCGKGPKRTKASTRQRCEPWAGTDVRKHYERTKFAKPSDGKGTTSQAWSLCQPVPGDRTVAGVHQCNRKGKNCVYEKGPSRVLPEPDPVDEEAMPIH